MVDSYSMASPLVARHIVGSILSHMDTSKDTVPVPHGFIALFEKLMRKLDFDGPFPEMVMRLKPLLADYERERFYGNITGIEPDGRDVAADNNNNNNNNNNSDDNITDGTNSSNNIRGEGQWFWVSLVPYRIFETFCAQHVHGWWYRYNLTRGVLEFVSFHPNGKDKDVITMQEIPQKVIGNIPAWIRPAK